MLVLLLLLLIVVARVVAVGVVAVVVGKFMYFAVRAAFIVVVDARCVIFVQ